MQQNQTFFFLFQSLPRNIPAALQTQCTSSLHLWHLSSRLWCFMLAVGIGWIQLSSLPCPCRLTYSAGAFVGSLWVLRAVQTNYVWALNSTFSKLSSPQTLANFINIVTHKSLQHWCSFPILTGNQIQHIMSVWNNDFIKMFLELHRQ